MYKTIYLYFQISQYSKYLIKIGFAFYKFFAWRFRNIQKLNEIINITKKSAKLEWP